MKCIQNNLCLCFLVGGCERLDFLVVVSGWLGTEKTNFCPVSCLYNLKVLIPFFFYLVQRKQVTSTGIFTEQVLCIESAMIHSYLKFWCHLLSLKMSYWHWLLLIWLLPTLSLLTSCLSSWMMCSSLQNLPSVFSWVCFKAESFISCATCHIRDAAIHVKKTVTVIKSRLMERLFLCIWRVPGIQHFLFSYIQKMDHNSPTPNSAIFCPLFFPHVQMMILGCDLSPDSCL